MCLIGVFDFLVGDTELEASRHNYMIIYNYIISKKPVTHNSQSFQIACVYSQSECAVTAYCNRVAMRHGAPTSDLVILV